VNPEQLVAVVKQASSWAPLNLVELEPREARKPDLGGMLYPGLRHSLSAEPEAGKTLLARGIALDLIRNGESVAWLDFEADAWLMVEQMRCFGATDEDLSRLVYVNPTEPIGAAGAADAITTTLQQFRPALVVVDAFIGLLDLHELDPWKSADIEKAFRGVVGAWRAEGAAVLVIDHVVKSRGDRGRFAAGSERKLGAVDVHLGLENVKPFGRGRQGRSKIIVHKDRHGWLHRPRLGDFVLESDEDGRNIAWEIEPPAEDDAGTDFRPTLLMERVSIYMEALGESATRTQIENDVKGKAEWIRVATDRLLAEGHLTKAEGRGKRVEHAKPFRDTSPSESVPNTSQDGLSESVPRPRLLSRDGDDKRSKEDDIPF
jgi:AAA domain-containing protein